MRVVVIGAGIAGLVAARRLVEAGVDVRVVDKGRSVGGRLATRRIAGARLDHGAQFFTVRSDTFRDRVDDWVDRGLASVWNHGFDPDGDDGHPRYVATGGMNSLAKDLATGIEVETSTMVFDVSRPDGADGAWRVAIDDGTHRDGDAVIITCPLPQAVALLVDTDLELEGSPFRTEYDRTIALLATLSAPPAVPAPGGVQEPGGILGFVGDNRAKGISEVDAVTFHATAEWSEEHWDDDVDSLESALREAAAPWLGGAPVVEAQVKRWRFATPRSIWPDPFWSAAEGTLVAAGDAFAGPRVEGAHDSGLAAAESLLA
ncbi:NAD(P)/FAD-dependent oxidoreductase [Ilumatobacter sp.]|uniref:NAD(P)/FAD-dependent oxidoreductase n=1 Tax=Ilumatobacter sp. TaxID=1967498 RepID=UPI003B521819